MTRSASFPEASTWISQSGPGSVDFAELEKAGWTDPAVAASYADAFATAAEHCVPAIVAASGAEEGDHALDLCCGPGIVAQGLLDAGAKVTGLDFSPAMLRMAQARAPEAEFVEGDAMALPFAPASFDAVTMGFGILHVPDAPTAVAEAARVLRPGGRFVYSCWHGPERESALPVVLGAVQRHGSSDVTLPPSLPAHHYAQPEHARALMAGAGLEDLRFETVDSFWLCKSADDPLRFFAEGTVRGAALLRAQPPETFAAIRREVMAWVERHGVIDPESEAKRVPIPAVVVSGQKPSTPDP